MLNLPLGYGPRRIPARSACKCERLASDQVGEPGRMLDLLKQGS